MKTFKTFLITGILMGLAIGCSTTQNRENMLSAAGFRMVPANTPERQAHLTSLPADKITPEYRRLRLQKQMADEQLAAAQMNENDWGVWGAWGGPGWAWR